MKSLLLSTLALLLLCSCATVPDSQAKRDEQVDDVNNAIKIGLEKDPTLQEQFDTAYGYAVFPSVGKGGAGIGGAFGRGQVFEGGKRIGYASLTQASIGFQFGGQSYIEYIFFKDKVALDRFKTGNFAFDARVSAVAVDVGAAAQASYSGGVMVFTITRGGLMYEASVGGQKFDFKPLSE